MEDTPFFQDLFVHRCQGHPFQADDIHRQRVRGEPFPALFVMNRHFLRKVEALHVVAFTKSTFNKTPDLPLMLANK